MIDRMTAAELDAIARSPHFFDFSLRGARIIEVEWLRDDKGEWHVVSVIMLPERASP